MRIAHVQSIRNWETGMNQDAGAGYRNLSTTVRSRLKQALDNFVLNHVPASLACQIPPQYH